MRTLGYDLSDIDFEPAGWSADELEDMAFIQFTVQLNTGFEPSLGVCRAVWIARSECYDASWLVLPKKEQNVWEDIYHLFQGEWTKRPGWLAKHYRDADPMIRIDGKWHPTHTVECPLPPYDWSPQDPVDLLDREAIKRVKEFRANLTDEERALWMDRIQTNPNLFPRTSDGAPDYMGHALICGRCNQCEHQPGEYAEDD